MKTYRRLFRKGLVFVAVALASRSAMAVSNLSISAIFLNDCSIPAFGSISGGGATCVSSPFLNAGQSYSGICNTTPGLEGYSVGWSDTGSGGGNGSGVFTNPAQLNTTLKSDCKTVTFTASGVQAGIDVSNGYSQTATVAVRKDGTQIYTGTSRTGESQGVAYIVSTGSHAWQATFTSLGKSCTTNSYTGNNAAVIVPKLTSGFTCSITAP